MFGLYAANGIDLCMWTAIMFMSALTDDGALPYDDGTYSRIGLHGCAWLARDFKTAL